MRKRKPIKSEFTAILQREDDGFVAYCPELEVVSQGDTVEQARANLREAVELFLETASEKEIRDRMRGETYISSFEVKVG
ncbi:MAG TPA: type II toxin-antitoxin system HicB family antitoxin [bacterium]|nr:type II toxin-antitoxin system HicB family antitoxin [bacterium]